MKTIMRELLILAILIGSAFCRTFAAIFRAFKTGFEWLDTQCVNLSDKILKVLNDSGYDIVITETAKSDK